MRRSPASTVKSLEARVRDRGQSVDRPGSWWPAGTRPTSGRPRSPQECFAPASSPRASRPRCTSTTSIPTSSSITRRVSPYAAKPRSTIHATSPSAAVWRISRGCVRSASKPTDVCSTSNESAMTAPSANKRSTGATDRGRGPTCLWPSSLARQNVQIVPHRSLRKTAQLEWEYPSAHVDDVTRTVQSTA
jgi:hypothetical protein